MKQQKRLQQLPPLSRLGFATGLRDQIACSALMWFIMSLCTWVFFSGTGKTGAGVEGLVCSGYSYHPHFYFVFLASTLFFFLFKAAININRKLGKHVREMISLHLLKAAETVPAITPLTFH